MSSNEVTPPNGSNDALVNRYRAASELIGETPSANVRARVLTEATRIAQEKQAKAGRPPRATPRAANDSNWRYALAASVFIASVTGFIAFQLTADLSEDRAADASPAPSASSAEKTSAKPDASAAAASASAPASAEILSAPTSAAATPTSTANREVTTGASQSTAAIEAPTHSTARSSTSSESSPAVAKRAAPPAAATGVTQERIDARDAAQAPVAATPAPAANESAGLALRAPAAAPMPAPAPAPTPLPAPAAAATPPPAGARGAVSVAAESANFSVQSAAAPSVAARTTQQKVAVADSARASGANTDANQDVARERAPSLLITPPSTKPRVTSAQTQLRGAIDVRDVVQIERAIANGADPNATDADGDLPLVRAVRTGASGVVAALLKGGAQVNARNSRGESALDVAERSNQSTIAALLREAGAR